MSKRDWRLFINDIKIKIKEIFKDLGGET